MFTLRHTSHAHDNTAEVYVLGYLAARRMWYGTPYLQLAPEINMERGKKYISLPGLDWMPTYSSYSQSSFQALSPLFHVFEWSFMSIRLNCKEVLKQFQVAQFIKSHIWDSHRRKLVLFQLILKLLRGAAKPHTILANHFVSMVTILDAGYNWRLWDRKLFVDIEWAKTCCNLQ